MPWEGESSVIYDSDSTADRTEEKTIDVPADIWCVAFLVDGKPHVVCSGKEGMIRRWRVEDGKEVGTPMNVRGSVWRIAVSGDGKWIVSGTQSGMVTVWNATNHAKVTEFKAHSTAVQAVDISPDGTKIVTGSSDGTVSVWSLSTFSQRLLDPLKHSHWVVTAKFSPNGRLIATATLSGPIRIYHSQNGRLLVEIPFKATNSRQCFAWTSDSKRLFALSLDQNIHCLDVSNGTMLQKWSPTNSDLPCIISLTSDDKFIAASDGRFISLWDTTTHKQIAPLIYSSDHINSMAISADYTLVTGGGNVTLRNLYNILTLYDYETTIEFLRAQVDRSNTKITGLEKTVQQLRTQFADSQQKTDERDGLLQIIRTHEQKHQCEVLFAKGCITEAANSLLEIANTLTEDVKANRLIVDWLAEFTNRCISKLESIGDVQLATEKCEEALLSYFTALLLCRSVPNTLLTKWASMALRSGSANDTLGVAARFKLPRSSIYRVICNTLESDGRITEAIKCFQQMQSGLGEETRTHDEQAQWELDFRWRCVDKLEKLGDAAMESKDYDAANGRYTAALILRSTKECDILLKRSEARTLMHSWEEALLDADKAIELDPSLPRGYAGRRAALLGARRYDEAIDAYNQMLLKIKQSSDPITRESRVHYVSPSETVATIRSSMKRQLRDTPLAIINTETGRLRDTHERMADFEADPLFKELVATMTRPDHARIAQTVHEYFQYATFSHTWEGAGPLYQDVRHESVHKLPLSPTTSKLLMFIKIAQEARLRWAWSDICCINRADDSVVEECVKSMFKWYQGSSLTITHLKGVWSDSDVFAFIQCLWNTRAWTLQEFFASRVIRFYTEDWKTYLPREIIHNHKESAPIMCQMAGATGVHATVLLSLRPGLDNVRQKLSLAASRAATEPEDMAYSLFGIFNVSLSVAYGEGQECALGRLLEEVLTRSGDVAILAWTGKASNYNSCLPAGITVYRDPVSPYIPSPMEESELNTAATEVQTSLAGTLDSALMLYDLIIHLPPPRLVGQRLTLSCIMFPLRGQLISGGGSRQHVYRNKTPGLGTVEIETREDLSSMEHLVLVHPWSKCLADPDDPFEDLIEEDDDEPLTPLDSGDEYDPDAPFADAISLSPSHTISPPSHPSQPCLDRRTRAHRLFARLRQPFGALLLAPLSTTEYKRVASDNPIMVQLSKNVTPAHLVRKIHHLTIL